MRRIVTGIVALLGAVVLCVVAAPGSTAYWQATVETREIVLETGSLTVTSAPGAWTGDPIDDARGAIPGDQLVYEKTVTVERSGTFPVRLTLGVGALSRLDLFALTSAELSGDVTPDGSAEWILDEGVTAATVTVRLTYAWPRGDQPDNATQDISLTIDDGTLLVFQDGSSS
jgi:alternate signal-mediated exported protein